MTRAPQESRACSGNSGWVVVIRVKTTRVGPAWLTSGRCTRAGQHPRGGRTSTAVGAVSISGVTVVSAPPSGPGNPRTGKPPPATGADAPPMGPGAASGDPTATPFGTPAGGSTPPGTPPPPAAA